MTLPKEFSEKLQELMLKEIKTIGVQVLDAVQEFSSKLPDGKMNQIVQGVILCAIIDNLIATIIYSCQTNKLDCLDDLLETIKRNVITKLIEADNEEEGRHI